MSLVMISFSFADYSVVIGKGLPKESINFVDRTPPPPPPPPEPELPPQPVCKYSYPTDYWLNGRNTAYSIVHVVDNSVFVHNGKDISIPSVVVGNFKYTRGLFIGNFGDYARYNICKVAI
jgi:hypothetical protein